MHRNTNLIGDESAIFFCFSVEIESFSVSCIFQLYQNHVIKSLWILIWVSNSFLRTHRVTRRPDTKFHTQRTTCTTRVTRRPDTKFHIQRTTCTPWVTRRPDTKIQSRCAGSEPSPETQREPRRVPASLSLKGWRMRARTGRMLRTILRISASCNALWDKSSLSLSLSLSLSVSFGNVSGILKTSRKYQRIIVKSSE